MDGLLKLQGFLWLRLHGVGFRRAGYVDRPQSSLPPSQDAVNAVGDQIYIQV